MTQTIQRALVSVYDKTGVLDFVKTLVDMNVEIISTGGTRRLLVEGGIDAKDVSEYTGYPEMMDGRVKTLHPRVHGGLLAVRDNPEHLKAMEANGIRRIDMVVVNLYPFEATVAKPGVTLEEAIEQIDIGGPSMIRSAAKNHRYVTVVTSPAQYDRVLDEMRKHKGATTFETRAALAREVFRLTSHYDGAIADYLARQADEGGKYPGRLEVGFEKVAELRYGENPHLSAAFYRDAACDEPGVGTAELVAGGPLSYNNYLDADGAFEIVKEFDRPAASVIKHTNPCGAAVADSLPQAVLNAYSGDPVSAFGDIIGLNRPLDLDTARTILEPANKPKGVVVKVDIIIAPGFDPEAVELIRTARKWGARTVFLRTGPLTGDYKHRGLQMRTVTGGMLVQDRNFATWVEKDLKVVTKRKPTASEMRDLYFAWVVAKHVKSNTILLAKDETVVGVGAGQMSRVDAAMIAAYKAGDRAKGSVCASDAFFPYPDGVEKVCKAGATAIVQPGGSAGDDKAVAMADQYDVAMIFTGMRHFRH
ncbi:MAG TPA: bifunctional phosphoribosylaminoimidazolecarboxamide formyltransferase/IMP cyclohydrolase [Planctomycetota bacterium]|nr:bifunctional phosphoribosylaminoimidazolecarboxamide formyltransferase/IMP cyclohydrolase [Planctomycetota bacterium]